MCLLEVKTSKFLSIFDRLPLYLIYEWPVSTTGTQSHTENSTTLAIALNFLIQLEMTFYFSYVYSCRAIVNRLFAGQGHVTILGPCQS